MGVYTRFKRSPDGFRNLVTLLESTPLARRKKMVEAGMAEDPEYTRKALLWMFTFEDLLTLPEVELAAVLEHAPSRILGYALAQATPEVQEKFLRNSPIRSRAEIRDYMTHSISLSDIGGAQLKLVELTRKAEKEGRINTKRIPPG